MSSGIYFSARILLLVLIGSWLALVISLDGFSSSAWFFLSFAGLFMIRRAIADCLLGCFRVKLLLGIVIVFLLYSFFVNFYFGLDDFNKSRLEREFYLLGIFPVVFLLSYFRIGEVDFVRCFILSGLILLFCLLHYFMSGSSARMDGAVNAIYYGNTALMVAIFCVLGGWISESKWVRGMAILAGLSALMVFIYSGSRGGLLAFILFGCLCLCYLFVVKKRRFLLIFAAFLLLIGSFSLFSDPVQRRFENTTQEIQKIADGNYNTSIGMRFLMWDAAFSVFKESPVFGAGYSAYVAEINRRGDAGIPIYNRILNYGGDPHNQFLHQAAAKGMVGLLLYLALILIPCYILLGYLRHADRRIVAVAFGLIAFFMIFLFSGLTITLLDQRKMLVIFGFFYSFTIYFISRWEDGAVGAE